MSNFTKALNDGVIRNTILASVQGGDTYKSVGSVSAYVNGKQVKRDLKTPIQQSTTAGLGRDSIQIPLSPAPAGNSLTNTNTYQYLLTPGLAELVRGLRLDLVISESGGSNSVTACSPFMFFQKIEIIANGGSGDIINTLYGETLWADTNIFYDNSRWMNLAPWAGSATNWAPSSAGASSMVLAASGYQNLTIPLFTAFDIIKPVLNQFKDSFLLKFYFRNSVVTGSGTLNLSSMSLWVDHNDLADYNLSLSQQFYNAGAYKYSYLDRVNVSQTMTLTKSIQNKFSLQGLIGKVAFLLVTMRSSVSPTSNGYTNCAALGVQNSSTQGNIMIQNEGAEDILAHGSGLNLVDLASINARFFGENDMFITNQNIYAIPFCNSVRDSIRGINNGFYYFPGTAYNLVIQPDSTFTNGSYVVDVWAYYFRSAYVQGGSITIKNF